jgi:hypothetical protein
MRKHPANVCQSLPLKSRRNRPSKWRRASTLPLPKRIELTPADRSPRASELVADTSSVVYGRSRQPPSQARRKESLRCLTRLGEYLSACIYDHETGGYFGVIRPAHTNYLRTRFSPAGNGESQVLKQPRIRSPANPHGSSAGAGIIEGACSSRLACGTHN